MSAISQTDPLLAYRELPAAPDSFSAAGVVIRMVDALGFRYHWATEGLRNEDLDYRPSEDARSTIETLRHVYDLSAMIHRAVVQDTAGSPPPRPETLEGLRRQTLEHLYQSRLALQAPGLDLETCQIRTGSGKTFPFWYVLNGPLADALTHVGQINSMRRASGNPIPAGVNVFLGKTGN